MAEMTPRALAREAFQSEKARAGGVWALPGFSWALFEFARNPYYLLIVIYIFPPYFAKAVVGDPVRGQEAIASALFWAGLICALTGPALGAVMDRSGRRKPVLAFFLAAMSICATLLWWSTPQGLGVGGTVAVLTTAFCAYTYTEVMHNAMLPQAGRADVLSRISGAGLGLGNAAAVLCLIAFIMIVQSPRLFGHTQVELQTLAPRGLGPAMAVWLAAFVIPFFVFVPDGAPPGGTWRGAAADILNPQALAASAIYVRGLFKAFPQAMRFLLGRMIYADGLTSVMAIGGVYTSGVLGWSQAEVAIYAIYGSIFAAIGGFLGGQLDRSIGARAALIGELSVFLVAAVAILSITKTTIFFGLVASNPHVWASPLFASTSDLTYLGFVAVLSCSLTACLASSRFMLVTVAPTHRISEFFGFFALAASATVWIGPALNGLVTHFTHSQRLGMSTALLLVASGLALMIFTVKHDGRPSDGKGA